MSYINTQTLQYPISEAEIRAAHTDTIFPTPFQAPESYAFVFPVPRPETADTHYTVEAAPEISSKGTWQQVWQTKKYTTAQYKAIQEAALAQLQSTAVQQVQQRLDDFAKTKGYDSILSACSYATSKNAARSTEGQLCVDLRDATWDALYKYQDDVLAGTIPAPKSYADIEAALPALAWTE